MPDEMERVPNAYQDTLLGRAYARAHLRQQGAILQAPQPEPQPMESGSLVGQPAPAGRSRLQEQAEQQQRRYDEVLAEAFAASDAVDCRPPERSNGTGRPWSARGTPAQRKHAAARSMPPP
jgi:hypothetical protein